MVLFKLANDRDVVELKNLDIENLKKSLELLFTEFFVQPSLVDGV